MRSWWGSRVGLMAVLASGVLGAGLAACGGGSEAEPDAAGADDAAVDVPIPVDEDAAAPAPEAGVRDVAAPDAAGKGFCATRSPTPRFCDDFDDGDLDDDWTIQTVLNGAPILDTSSATSIPASFAVETLPIGSNQSAHVHLRASVDGAPTGHVILAFDLMLATTSYTKGTIAIATLDISQDHFFTLYLRDGDPDAPAPALEETNGATRTRHVLSKLPPVLTWTHATIDIDIGAAQATVLWDSEKVLDAAPIAAGPADEPTIRVGAVYVYGPADPFEARFDDVTLDF